MGISFFLDFFPISSSLSFAFLKEILQICFSFFITAVFSLNPSNFVFVFLRVFERNFAKMFFFPFFITTVFFSWFFLKQILRFLFVFSSCASIVALALTLIYFQRPAFAPRKTLTGSNDLAAFYHQCQAAPNSLKFLEKKAPPCRAPWNRSPRNYWAWSRNCWSLTNLSTTYESLEGENLHGSWPVVTERHYRIGGKRARVNNDRMREKLMFAFFYCGFGNPCEHTKRLLYVMQ